MRLWGSSAITKAMMVLRPYQQGILVANTAAQAGEWARLTALQDTVIATITADGFGTQTTVTLKSGTSIEGHITAFTLTSGSVMAYALP